MGQKPQFPGRTETVASWSEDATVLMGDDESGPPPNQLGEDVECPDCYQEHAAPKISGTMQCGQCGTRFYCLVNRNKPSWFVLIFKALIFAVLVVFSFSLLSILFVFAVFVDLAHDARNAVSTLFFDSVYQIRQPHHERVLNKLGPLVRDQYRMWLTGKPIVFTLPPHAGVKRRPFWMEGLALLFLFFTVAWYSPEVREFLSAMFVDLAWPVALGLVALGGATIGNLISAFRSSRLIVALGSMLVASAFSIAIYIVYW